MPWQVAALKNLGLNIRRAKLQAGENGVVRHKFFITDSATAEKVRGRLRVPLIFLGLSRQHGPHAGAELRV